MEADDVTELVTFPSSHINESFDSSQVEHIRSLGGQHPFFLQIACYHTLEVARSGASGKNARELVESKFIYEAEPHMEYLAGRMSPREHAVLGKWLDSGNLMNLDGAQELLRKGILVRDPEPRLFSSVFKNYIHRIP